MRRKIPIIATLAVLISVALTTGVFAAGQLYVDKQRTINAGVLVPTRPNSTLADPAAPFVFYIMGAREDAKPHAWNFVNPLAGGRDSFKNVKDYWLVSLPQTTFENLIKFDVLYLSTTQLVNFRMADKDKLRRFVDGGGCLWVDGGAGMTFSSVLGDAFFLPQMNFVSGGSGIPMLAQRLHPVVTNPFWLNQDEITILGQGPTTINPGYDSGFGSMPDPNTLSPVVLLSGGLGAAKPTIATVEYGSGRIVVTSHFIGGMIERPVTGNTAVNVITTQNSNLMFANTSALRFAYNVVAYGSSSTSFRKNYRRSGVSIENLAAPLDPKWRAPIVSPGGATIENSPVIWKNMIFVTSGNTIYAFDANPEFDLDQNGNLDDGVPNPGQPFDLVWSYSCPGQISSPTVATMLDPRTSGQLSASDFIMVNCTDGRVYVFDTVPVDSSTGMIATNPGAAQPIPSFWKVTMNVGSGPLLPPVAQNGWIYCVGSDGVVYAYSPIISAGSGTFDLPADSWAVPLFPGTSGYNVSVKSGPLLGYVKNQTNGAIVQVLYVVARPPMISTDPNAGNPNDCIYALPLYVCSDRLMPRNPNALRGSPTGAIPFRIGFLSGMGTNLPVSKYPAPEVWAYNPVYNAADADAVTPVPVEADFQQSNTGTVNITVTPPNRIGPNIRVYATYGIDYSAFQSSMSAPVPMYELKPKVGGSVDIINLSINATPAMGSNDTLYMGVKNDSSIGDPGSGHAWVYSVWFDGNPSAARLKWNYFLHGGGLMQDPTSTVSSTGRVPLDAADPSRLWGVRAKDPVTGAIVPVRHLEVRSTPAVTRDKVFAIATTDNPGSPNLPRSYLLCFKADSSFVIRLNRSLYDTSNNQRMSVKLWQPDFLFNTANVAQSPLLTSVQVPSDMIDYNSGTVTINDFAKLRVQGSSISGVQTSPLTPSLPVWVFINNQPVPINEVDLSSWDNLLWALPIPNNGSHVTSVSSSPIVLGDYVYFVSDDGYLYSVLAEVNPPNPKTKMLDVTAKDSESWFVVQQIDPAGASGTNRRNLSLAGGNGLLAVPTDSGLYVFKNQTTLVTDNRRVMEIGSDGRVIWSCDSVIQPEIISDSVPPVYGILPQELNKPLVAQKLGSSDYLVVDSGNDRVIRMDKGGQVTWSLSQFIDPQGLLRSGEPLRLKNPSDAVVWGEFEKRDGKWYYLYHCLVADSGNFRIVDIVNRFNANDKMQILSPYGVDSNGRPIHELNWVSQTTSRDKRYSYNSIELVRGNPGGDPSRLMNWIWASTSNYGLGTATDPTQKESTGGGQLGGAIISMEYRESASANSAEWNYLDGRVDGQLTTLLDNKGAGPAIALSRPSYFTVLDSGTQRLLICDSSAVYVTEGRDIQWKFTSEDYRNMPREVINEFTQTPVPRPVRIPIPFSPQRAQMLDDGTCLIVNSFAGRMYDKAGSKFTGEIFRVDSSHNLRWFTPRLWWVPDTPTSQPGDDGVFVQKTLNAPNMDQPTSAQRLK